MKKNKSNTGKKNILLILIIFFLSAGDSSAEEKITLLLTSNLEGNFSYSVKGQEKSDPLILLGQSILFEKRKGSVYYFDLGNAFYPGVLSKYSYGSSVMDFFKYFACESSLVSSMDLRIGINNLEFLQKGNNTLLLSANIKKDKKHLFKPYKILKINNKRIAFIGISSKKILFDIAEKNINKILLEDEMKSIRRILAELKKKGITSVIILSGLGYKENIGILKSFEEVDLLISGGDNKGDLLNGRVMRLDLADSRSIVSLPRDKGYYVLNLSADKYISILDIKYKKLKHRKTENPGYKEFIKRLTGWKKQLKKEYDITIAETGTKPLEINQAKVSELLRDRFNAELAIVRDDSINSFYAKDKIKLIDIIAGVDDNYPVFTYELSGSDLVKLKSNIKGYTVSGYENQKIQGYKVDLIRKYKIVSSQWIFEKIKEVLNHKISFDNKWKSISEIIVEDLKKDKVLFKKDYGYLDRRLRFLIDPYLSFFFETSNIKKGRFIDLPPGEPEKAYTKWGVESSIDLTIYNRFHQFIFTPYINYAREGDIFLHNRLRGTFLYNLNLDFIIKPYHKSQINTVLRKVKGDRPDTVITTFDIIEYHKASRALRPTFIRETVGINFEINHFAGNIGLGFEKKIFDPAGIVVFGFESIIKIDFDFLKYFSYTFNLDSFLSIPNVKTNSEDKGHLRNEIENVLSFSAGGNAKISLKHRWFNYYSMKHKENYSNSQFITSVDFKTDFKFY